MRAPRRVQGFSRRALGAGAAGGMLWLAGLFRARAAAGADDPPQVEFLGLHGRRAKINVDRRLHLLAPGDTAKGRVTLLSVNASRAIVRIDATSYVFERGATLGVPLPQEVVLDRDPSGVFLARGAINGRSVDFVVDTGASYVSLSSEHARKIGLRYKRNRPVELQTASGSVRGYVTTLDSVRLGGIVRLDVDAVIVRGKFPSVVLLGATFLQGLRITQTETFMTISR